MDVFPDTRTSHLPPPGLLADLHHARQEAIYWRQMYEVMVRILAEQHDDPAYAWLDEITRTRAVL